ncbi:MAG: FAD-binding oxidoreductase, partial [Chrysiogenetes bacterium]|nr:FAD-binding oxidoreductase [Chrysiogenetes bacterium]
MGTPAKSQTKTQKTWKFPAPKKEIREALEKAFEGRMERVTWKSTDRAIYGRDLWPRELLSLRRGERPAGPAAIVLAKEARDVEATMKLSRSLGLPLVPYADGSGVCGGARAASDALVLDLKALNKIDPIDEKSLTVRAQCGVQGEKLERALNRAGYTLGHFPSSIYTSTVGGWVSTRSAGQLSTKYGKIEDMVVGLECVLPDGSKFVTPDAPRSAAGPDFKQIMIGAEGTLGIVT